MLFCRSTVMAVILLIIFKVSIFISFSHVFNFGFVVNIFYIFVNQMFDFDSVCGKLCMTF